MRVGFACDGLCDGGTWHGTGGDYVFSDDLPMWKRGLFIYAIFIALVGILLSVVNTSRMCLELDLEDDTRAKPLLDRLRSDYIPVEDLEYYVRNMHGSINDVEIRKVSVEEDDDVEVVTSSMKSDESLASNTISNEPGKDYTNEILDLL